MKKILLVASAFFGLAVLPMAARADTFTIYDGSDDPNSYWGGMITAPGFSTQVPSISDSTGGSDFDVDTMMVSRDDGSFSVTLTGSYFSSSTVPEYVGDLFLSSYGWNPQATDPSDTHYASDNSSSIGAENWNYVLHINTDTPITPGGGITNGTITLYQTADGRIVNTDDPSVPQRGAYRAGQELYYVPTQDQVDAPLAQGTWELDPTNGTFTFTLDTSNLDAADLAALYGDIGLHWTMSCGNDVVEGSSAVPEPASMLLFAAGLSGLAAYRRRARKE